MSSNDNPDWGIADLPQRTRLKQRLADVKANPTPLPEEARGPAERELIARFQRITNERNAAIDELDLLRAEVLRLQTERNALAVSNCGLREAKAELLEALEDVLRTGLNGGNNVRLSFMAASRDVLSKEDLARASASEDAVIKARDAIAKHGGQP